jgi:nitroimidazol reductase NimA-like FMN-containing flavoprotein (pyridoxamine 5'-phosphate oxidase superfamily)
MSKDKLQILDELILSREICVLATSDGMEPYTSLMTYLLDHASMKFFFLTRKDSRKSRNLRKCAHVSLLIDTREEHLPHAPGSAMALTIQGVYVPIKKPQTIDAIVKRFVIKYPHMSEFAAHPDTELVRIRARSAQLLIGFEDKFETKFENS